MEVAEMVRGIDYTDMDIPLSVDEMIAFYILLYYNNVGYFEQRELFPGFFGDTSNLSREEMVANFKKEFREETLNRPVRFLLTQQVHFGESNHVNDLTNCSFYTAMQEYHRESISEIEKSYAKNTQQT